MWGTGDMPITIKLVDNRYCPFVVCDFCGKEIKALGNVEYVVDREGQPHEPLYFTHKQCCGPFDNAHGGPGALFAEELDVFFYDVLHNSQVRPRKCTMNL